MLTVTVRLSYVLPGLRIFRDEGAKASPKIFQGQGLVAPNDLDNENETTVTSLSPLWISSSGYRI